MCRIALFALILTFLIIRPNTIQAQAIFVQKSCGCRCLDDKKEVIPIGGKKTWIADGVTDQGCLVNSNGSACGSDGLVGKAECDWGYYSEGIAGEEIFTDEPLFR